MSVNDLSKATDDQLIEEVLRRKSLACSIWSIEDVRPIVSEDCPELTDEQVVEVSAAFLKTIRRDLQDTLGSRGNEFIEDRWSIDSDAILSELGEPLSPR